VTPEFWQVVDEARPSDGDPGRHAQTLIEQLARWDAEQVRTFGAAFDGAMDALYRWDLWGTAYLALGGCGDDAFEYLRAWIVGRGAAAWRDAARNPEGFFLDLIGEAEDPQHLLSELGVHDGESLLYAAGEAHERITGDWLPPRTAARPAEPVGEAWREEELVDRFPNLAARIPEVGSAGGDPAEHPEAQPDPLLRTVYQGLAAFYAGDHIRADSRLAPLVDDDDIWDRLPGEEQVDVAYVVSAVRLQDGRVDAAAEALARIRDRIGEVPPVRRALAQIELARGRLDEARRWIDHSGDAQRMDRALAAKLAWRQGRRDDAANLAERELGAAVGPMEHPWDVAGALYQAGSVLAEAGDAVGAERAVRTVATLLAGAPEDLPLFTHMKLLVAAVTRLQGRHDDALGQLASICESTSGTDRAEALRERARCLRGLGRRTESAAAYDEALRGFEAAGERWDADATRREKRDAG
jgi:tetratricopeptide (TPR) repeat protein